MGTNYHIWSLISICLQSVERVEFIRHSKKLVMWALSSREKESPHMGGTGLETYLQKER